MTTQNSNIARQDEFVQTIKKSNFDFRLVYAKAFINGMRDIGYKSTATALFEILDNSLQAEASYIHLIFDFNKGKSGKTDPDRIAIIDDGIGMHEEMLRASVMWGGSDRINDRQGMGKYGYGLPSACVSIGQRFTVISKRAETTDWKSVTIDLEEINNDNPDYVEKKTGDLIVPVPKTVGIPKFIANYLSKHDLQIDHGTIVIIDKIDRLSRSSVNSLKSFLSLETGITYRNYLRQTSIYIDGESIDPVDPLFITDGYRYYDENDVRAKAYPTYEVKVQNSLGDKQTGTLKFRFAYFPYGWFDPKPKAKTDADDGDKDEEVDEIINNQNKKDKTKRLTVRKNNNGIIFLRKGRQIDVVDSKIPWTKIQNNDRYWGVEVDFSPELDEEFSITTSKQQIVASARIWNIIHDAGVLEHIQKMRQEYLKEARTAKALKNASSGTAKQKDEFVEGLMKEAAKDFEIDQGSQPQSNKKEAEENLTRETKKISANTGMSEDAVKKALIAQIESRPYKLDYFDEPEGPFYRAEQLGGQVITYINKSHRFYTDLFTNQKTDGFMKNALSMMVFVLGHSELRVTDEKRKWYKIERNAWSLKLDSTLETLSKYFGKTVDDQVTEEEFNEAKPNEED